MLSLDEARTLLLGGVGPLAVEEVPLHAAAGRVLAADIHAARDQPPSAVSAMDGYSVRAGDAPAGAVLRVIGEAPAGAPFDGAVDSGEAVRIATGGLVPAGADSIVIQEVVTRDGDTIRIGEAPGAGDYIRAAGCDFKAGERVAVAGEIVSAARLGLIAAANCATVAVYARPRVIILPSGDEVREPGSALAAGQIVNSAAYAIAALAEGWGADAQQRAILPDDRDACRAAIEAGGLDADVIVTLGGASVGDRDSLRPIFQDLGAVPVFDRIAVQPGKPTWHARLPGGALILGLPGNPASAFVCAHLLLKPLLYALSGRSPDTATTLTQARLTADLPVSGARETYLRATRTAIGEALHVTPMPRQDSSLQTPLAAANALIRRMPGAGPASAGAIVETLSLG